MVLPPSISLLRVHVYDYIREQLRLGNLTPGSIIRINDLSEETGIKRTPLRDALLQLQAEGFITFLPQRGILINELTPAEIRNIYEICGALDYRVILSSFDRIGEAEISMMEKYNLEMKGLKSADDHETFNEKNFSFHEIYTGLCPNEMLAELITMYRTRLFQFTKTNWGEAFLNANWTEHNRIIDLFKRGAREELAVYIRDVHWSVNWEDMDIKGTS